MESCVWVAPARITHLKTSTPLLRSRSLFSLKQACPLCFSSPATPKRAVVVKVVDSGILCEPCNGTGWLVCDFCNGQKTNVVAENKRIYRRCPSCRAIGFVLCSNCKVFKCVTFPNYNDGEELSF